LHNFECSHQLGQEETQDKLVILFTIYNPNQSLSAFYLNSYIIWLYDNIKEMVCISFLMKITKREDIKIYRSILSAK
jgi:hypothetical protein